MHEFPQVFEHHTNISSTPHAGIHRNIIALEFELKTLLTMRSEASKESGESAQPERIEAIEKSITSRKQQLESKYEELFDSNEELPPEDQDDHEKEEERLEQLVSGL